MSVGAGLVPVLYFNDYPMYHEGGHGGPPLPTITKED